MFGRMLGEDAGLNVREDAEANVREDAGGEYSEGC